MEGLVSQENQILQVEELDEWSEKRKSRLLNYPLSESDSQSFKSYFTVFVKIHDDDHEITTTDNNKLEKDDQLSSSTKSNEYEEVNTIPDFLKEFYSSQAIFKEISNVSSDLNSLKLLARSILKEDSTEATPSIDLFGEEILNKLTKGKKTDKKTKPSLTNKKVKPKGELKNKDVPNELITVSNDGNPENVGEGDIACQEKNDISEYQNEPSTEVKKQDDQNRNFVTLPLNNEFGVLLATVWENIESCYISSLKETLFENRFINLRLYPYCIYIEKEMKKVIDKQDLKQSLINIFQNHYNTISIELRTLPEMKNQLHCRVSELQQNLWEIADQRKIEIETKRQDLIYENWLVSEICLLINNYLSFVQIEFERSLETLKLVNDYYMNMLEKTPPPLTIQLENRTVGRISTEMLLDGSHEKLSETEQAEQFDKSSSEGEKKNNFIAHNLVSCSHDESFTNVFDSIFLEKVKEVKSNFHSILTIFHNQNKTEANVITQAGKEGAKIKSASNKERTSIKAKKETKKNKTSLKSNHRESHIAPESSIKETLIDEWQSTINTETERFNFRLDLIHQRAKENIFEFFCYVESVFCNLHTSILSSYNTDITNINSICDYLKTAIEEESPLQHPLILGQEHFFICIKDTEKESMDYTLRELREDLHECIFTVNQLHHLLDIFKISGPFGVIRKQPLCFILQDLMLLDTCDNVPYLPKIWGFLDDVQLRYVIDKIFGMEFGVDWRDFIIYNLDIPYPEVRDILNLRNQFLSHDLEETELIFVEDYENITLWFENELPSSPKQGLRFALVKKLLAEMFKVDREHINYTALLLYFCKDFNPVNGFKKALSLSLGKNVVVSKSELEVILQNEEEIDKIVCAVLKDIIDGIVLTRETAQVYDILESTSEIKLPSNESSNDSWPSSHFDSVKSFQTDSEQLEIDSKLSNSPPFVQRNCNKYSICFETPPSNEKAWVTRIPVSTVLSVLNASFFYQDRRYALKSLYLGCLEDEADTDGMIEAYDLVNLSCIQKLFTMTNKFKISIPCEIISECLKDYIKNEDDSMLKHYSNERSW